MGKYNCCRKQARAEIGQLVQWGEIGITWTVKARWANMGMYGMQTGMGRPVRCGR